MSQLFRAYHKYTGLNQFYRVSHGIRLDDALSDAGMHVEVMARPDGPGRRKAGHTGVLPFGLLGLAKKWKTSSPTGANNPIALGHLALSLHREMYQSHEAARKKKR
jgi:hypothetical protein